MKEKDIEYCSYCRFNDMHPGCQYEDYCPLTEDCDEEKFHESGECPFVGCET